MSHSKKFVKVVTPLALAIALAACGGGASFGSGNGNGGAGGEDPEKQASSLTLTASTRQLLSDGSKPVIITAIAKDKNNNAIAGADITFSVDNDATIDSEASAETESGSVKSVQLTPGTPKNRFLKVKAVSGSQSKVLDIEVVGTTVSIEGPDSIPREKDVSFVLKLLDSGNKPIAYETVELKSSKGNTITTKTGNFQTNPVGEIAFTLRGLTGGTDTLTATALGAEITKDVVISSDEFVLAGSDKEITINTEQTISFLWKKEGIPQPNKQVTISATRGILSTNKVVTDANGVATFTISSPTSGTTIIKATSDDGLSTSVSQEFVATTPSFINTQADPTTVAPKGSSTIIAKIRDINDNPVKNKRINFRLDDIVDGVLSDSTAVTDSLGRASVSYTAGNSSSAKNGVNIKTFIEGYPSIEDEVFLTVGGNALRIVLGQDNLVESDKVYYKKNFGVIVTDSAGNPVKGRNINFTIIPTKYYKGIMVPVPNVGWVKRLSTACPSEDLDNDGNLDNGEDDNGNGYLDPTHDAAVTVSGTSDENGRIDIQIIYPKNTALWSEQLISATTTVDGTEYIENTYFDLPIAASDVKNLKVSPPNRISPYGISASCTDTSGMLPTTLRTTIVDAKSGFSSGTVKNGIWYTIMFIDDFGNEVNKDYTITSDVATIETGPNNSFRLIDNDPAVDNSGFFVELHVGNDSKPLFYEDDAPVEK